MEQKAKLDFFYILFYRFLFGGFGLVVKVTIYIKKSRT